MSDQNVDICYLVSHGFAARMVLHTDVIPQIHARGMSVAIVVPSQAEAAAKNIEKRHGVKVYAAPDYVTPYRREYQVLRRYLFEDVESNPSLWPKHHYTRDQGAFRRTILDSYLLLNKLSLKSGTVRRGLEKLEDTMLASKEGARLLRELKPGVVVATYPVSRLESHIVKEAKRLGITTAGHLLSWDNITSKGRFPSPPDHYITWGPVMSGEVAEYYGKTPEFIHECGVAHFDRHLKDVDPSRVQALLREHNLDPGKPYLLFGMSSSYIAPKEVDIVTWLAEQVRANRFGEDMQLIVRPHPQNIKYDGPDPRAEELTAIAGPRVAINYPMIKTDGLEWNVDESDLDRLVALFAGSAVTLSSGSTFAIDGLMRDKPVIVTAFDGETTDLPWYLTANRILNFIHIRKLLEFGGCYVAEDYESLADGINRYLGDPSLDAAGREAARHGECGPCDGKTAQRVAEALEQILHGQTELQQNAVG